MSPHVSDNSYRKLTHAPPRLYYKIIFLALSLDAVMADTVQASKPEVEAAQDDENGVDDENDDDDDGFSDAAEV